MTTGASSGKSHGWRSLVGYSPWGLEESDTTEQFHFHFSFACIGEGNGNPLQFSCLENPRDGGVWWASVYGVRSHSVGHNWSDLAAAAAAAMAQWVKNLPAVQETLEMQFDSWIRKIPGGGNGNSLQYSCLTNHKDREAWQATILEVAKSRTWLSN